eukprot:32129_1
MGNKQECSKDDHEVPSTLTANPLTLSNPQPASVSIASEKRTQSTNLPVAVPHKPKPKTSLTDSTTPCSPLSSILHSCDHRIHRQSLPSHPHLEIKKSHSHSHNSPHSLNSVRKLTLTPTPSASPYSSLHLLVPTVHHNQSSWSETSMTNPYSEGTESQSDTNSASTPWILYMDVKEPTLTLEQLHHDEVMLSAPPSPSESIRSYEFIATVHPIAPHNSYTLFVEPVDIQ